MAMKTLYTDFIYPTEVHDVVKLFYNDVVFVADCGEKSADITLTERAEGSVYTYTAQFCGKSDVKAVDVGRADDLQRIRLRKRFAKVATYNCMSAVTGKLMPWGSLTGIRPTKLADQLVDEGENWQQYFVKILGVSEQKTKLVADILSTQGELHSHRLGADLYVGIPFCVTRCSYCSFTGGEIARLKKYVEPYIDALCRDITATLQFAREHNILLRNVYFGGGTPTSLSASQLDKIMSCIDFAPTEYTVEAGRPDTVDKSKFDVFAAHGVNRISINPQTFNQSVLDAVGRKHTVQDIYDKYQLAQTYGFAVNMDLIAGLPTETYEMFCNSVNSAIALRPHNITVHTLALKHGSVLKEQNYASGYDVSQMVEYSHQLLYSAGYMPYYLYRQKYMASNLENVGFCLPDTQCLYNIGNMEELSDIIACGSGAISKKIMPDQKRIERAANAKDVITYIARNDEFLAKKFQLFA